MMNVTEKLNAVFKTLRKNGFIAKQRFSCCCGCAAAAIVAQVEKMPAARSAKIRGFVFYTRQDNSNAYNRRGEFVGLYIAFARMRTVGLPVEEVGRALVEACTDAGLSTEWDGSPETRVLIRAACAVEQANTAACSSSSSVSASSPAL